VAVAVTVTRTLLMCQLNELDQPRNLLGIITITII
jgi:hypothetical protein